MFPNVEQYQAALQQNLSSIIVDKSYHSASIEMSALGIPRIRSGNFALVYKLKLSNHDKALRVFYRTNFDIANRYEEIIKVINLINKQPGNQNYFVETSYQVSGIRVDGNLYPIIIMDWSPGLSMGDFVSINYKNATLISNLQLALKNAFYVFEKNNIAHGDIQPGNVLVSKDGKNITFVDYDGMFCPSIKRFGASEIGHKNFQHPDRTERYFNEKLDYFAFGFLDSVLEIIKNQPNAWEASSSDEEGFIFRAHDFVDPKKSKVFSLLIKDEKIRPYVERIKSILENSFLDIPNPSLFYSKSNKVVSGKPTIISRQERQSVDKPYEGSRYIGNYEVIDANNFSKVFAKVGIRVELVGKIFQVISGKSQFGNNKKFKKYIYVDFIPPNKGNLVRIKVFEETIDRYAASKDQLPNLRWENKWCSINEVIQPVNLKKSVFFQKGINEIGVIIVNMSRITLISENQALFRLNKYTKSKPVNSDKKTKISSNKKSQFDKDSNINIIESMKRKL